MTALGINVPNFGPDTTAQTMLHWTRFAEDNGFEAVTISDHVAPTPDVTRAYPGPFYDPLTIIAWLAGQTRSVTFATSVLIVPYRHPLLVARISAMLQETSAGRFVLGVGAGWSRPEFAALGMDVAHRGRLTDEYLDVIVAAWREPRLTGRRIGQFQMDDVSTEPLPPGGAVPLWMGGASPAALRRAARFGAAWHPISPGREWLYSTALPLLRAEAERLGAPHPGFVPRVSLRLSETDAPDSERPFGTGSIAQIADDIAELREDAGAQLVVLDQNLPAGADPHRDFGREMDDLLAIQAAVRG